MKSHPYAKLFPLITGSELEELAADIDENGLNEPITTYQGMILDGRNRYEACSLLGKKPKFNEFSGSEKDALAYVLSANLRRRHLTDSQRGMVAAEMANTGRGKPNSANLQIMEPLISQAKAAEAVSVSTRTVAAAAAVKNTGIDELTEAVKSGEVPVSVAAEVAKLPPAKQRAAVTRGEKGMRDAAKKAKADRKEKDKPEPVSEPAADEESSGTDGQAEPAEFRQPADRPTDNPVPDPRFMAHAADAAKYAGTMKSLKLRLDSVRSEFRRMFPDRRHVMARRVDSAKWEATIGELIETIDGNVPDHVCPPCFGQGIDPEAEGVCKYCDGYGIVDKGHHSGLKARWKRTRAKWDDLVRRAETGDKY